MSNLYTDVRPGPLDLWRLNLDQTVDDKLEDGSNQQTIEIILNSQSMDEDSSYYLSAKINVFASVGVVCLNVSTLYSTIVRIENEKTPASDLGLEMQDFLFMSMIWGRFRDLYGLLAAQAAVKAKDLPLRPKITHKNDGKGSSLKGKGLTHDTD